eukprot:Em0008g100a
MSAEKIPVRLTYKGKEYRFTLNDNSALSELVGEIRKQTGIREGIPFNLKWLDVEGDPVSIDVDRSREWDEALRLHVYNQENEMIMHVFEGMPPLAGQLCEGEDAKLYQRRGARRWKKIRRINNHAFVAKRFQAAFCFKCNDRIWGLGRQGYKCDSCKLVVHKRCCYFLTPEEVCEGHPPVKADGEVDTTVNDEKRDPHDSGTDEYNAHLKKDGTNPVSESQISLDDFNILKVIGRGSYAKVLMVELKKTKRIYAMKVIKKDLVMDEEDIDWVQTEKHVFEQASNHPFLVGLHSCFQTESRLFFVIECVNGGDLMFHMQRHRRLPEEHARFYSAEICLALNFLHERVMPYRKPKPSAAPVVMFLPPSPASFSTGDVQNQPAYAGYPSTHLYLPTPAQLCLVWHLALQLPLAQTLLPMLQSFTSIFTTIKETSGTMNLGGSLTRQAETDSPVNESSPHIVNIGRMVEVSFLGCGKKMLLSACTELRGHGEQDEVYFGPDLFWKNKDVVNDLRSVSDLKQKMNQKAIADELLAKMQQGH